MTLTPIEALINLITTGYSCELIGLTMQQSLLEREVVR